MNTDSTLGGVRKRLLGASRRLTRRTLMLACAVVLASVARSSYTTGAVTATPALPNVYTPFDGDPRLEPIPGSPLNLVNLQAFTTDQFGTEKILDMRFPPRVNGQNQSDGDAHADLYVLFDEVSGFQIAQPVILEAVPKNAKGPSKLSVSDLDARNFSAIWEVHAVIVESGYNPFDFDQRIDSAPKVFTSPKVKKIIQTNIFLNCPVVPNGTTVAAGSAKPEQAFFDTDLLTIVPYDVEDGPFHVQILYKFEDTHGNTLGRAMAPQVGDSTTPITTMLQAPPAPGAPLPATFMPHIVATHALGDPDYTSIWDLQTIVVPDSAVASIGSMRSAQKIETLLTTPGSGWTKKSANIRLDCPVVAVTDVRDKSGVPISPAVRVPVPVEDWKQLLSSFTIKNVNYFREDKFPFDVPLKQFTKSRTFQITEVTPGGGGLVVDVPVTAVSTTGFPPVRPEVAGAGNVIPLILKNPYQTTGTSGPATNGPFYHMDQADLDNGTLGAGIEANFALLIANGDLAPEWAVDGGHTFQERLAVVGRAYFELIWRPEDGANAHDVTACLACHSMPSSGGSARGLYNLERAIAGGSAGAATKGNAGSAFGSGSASVLVNQLIAAHKLPATADSLSNRIVDPVTGVFAGVFRQVPRAASGSQASNIIRADIAGASNTHFGIQSVEFILGKKCHPSDAAVVGTISAALLCDNDNDGVVGEATVGDVTAEAVFFMSLALPDEGDSSLKAALGITDQSVQSGRQLFRKSIANGGIGCASCHTVFHKFDAAALDAGGYPSFQLTRPDENNQQVNTISIRVPYHVATAEDVADGLADWVGQRGLRPYGDFLQHQLGCDSPGLDASGNEIHGLNPLLEAPTTVNFFTALTGTATFKPAAVMNLTRAKSAELWDVGSAAPLFRTGSGGFDLKAAILAHGGPAVLPAGCVADGVNGPERIAIDSRNAFAKLSSSQQKDVINFLRVQTIQSKVGEGSGAKPPVVVTAIP